jgi:acetyltransferase-like isoleucine patch superfamily enzyme
VSGIKELPERLEDTEEDEKQLRYYPVVSLASRNIQETRLMHFDKVLPPFTVDYGSNLFLGEGCFINFNCTALDTCRISIGARTLLGPNVSFFSASHPVDPGVRDGLNGPENGEHIVGLSQEADIEAGKPIGSLDRLHARLLTLITEIEEDCWIGGNVTILPGVTVGRGILSCQLLF